MNVDFLLKREGISNICELNSNDVRTISSDIAIKLCLAFPEHSFNRQQLFNSFCNLKMYTASMPNDSSGAKYVAETNSIYFNNKLDFTSVPDVAMHECIHYLQNSFSAGKKETSHDFFSELALNEAAVQLMASEANMSNVVEEKYFDISLRTNSPDFYPLECALVNELVYFTGTFPLYHSVLFNSDVFKNTFCAKFSKRIYDRISKLLDKLLQLENDLYCYTKELSVTEKINDIKELNSIIVNQRQAITKMFFSIQNYIIRNCFTYDFNNIRDAEDLHNFKNKLYNFKNIMGTSSNYTFYNNFYCDLMNALDQKQIEVAKFGEISLFKEECTSLAIIDDTKYIFKFVHTFIQKIKKLFKLNTGSINDYTE